VSPTVAGGPLSATFPTLTTTSSYASGLQINLPEQYFTRLYQKDAYNQLGFSKPFVHKSQLAKASVKME